MNNSRAVRHLRVCRIAVAAEIGNDHGELLGELRRNFMPCRMGFRVTVQQQQRTAAALPQHVDGRPACLDRLGRKARKELIGL